MATINGTQFSNVILGTSGSDTINGFAGDDLITAGAGSDRIIGGEGNDTMRGEGGGDTFVIDVGNPLEGDDVISDFATPDKIEFDLGSLLTAAPGLAVSASLQPPAAGTISTDANVTLASLDQSDRFGITRSPDGFVTINHPGGSVELQGLTSSAFTDSFASLSNFITIVDHRPAGSEVITGLNNVPEDIGGGDGDDVLFGGTGPDAFVFFPHNGQEGNDVIGDFNPAEDRVAFDVANLLAAEPDLASAAISGSPGTVDLADLDASGNFSIFETANGSVGIRMPHGSVALDGVAFNTGSDTFTELANVIELRDVLENPAPEQNAIDGFIEQTGAGQTAGSATATANGATAGTPAVAGGTAGQGSTTGLTAGTEATAATTPMETLASGPQTMPLAFNAPFEPLATDNQSNTI